MTFRDDLKVFVEKNFPIWKNTFDPAPTIISDAIIDIKKSTFAQIEQIVRSFYNLRHNKDYVASILKNHPSLLPQCHYSVLMSFDFHIIDGSPKLIEINTNASFALLAYVVDQYGAKLSPQFLEKLQNSFINDYKLFSKKSDIRRIAIVDENPREQKAYFEFLMYQELFNFWNWDCDILNIVDVEPGYDFIYNRHTDFYLSQPISAKLKTLYDRKLACLSPHPTEYALLADKTLFLKFQDKNFLEKFVSSQDTNVISACIPATFEFNNTDTDDIWNKRKKYIFKPKNSFGGKAIYKGDSISRNKFDDIRQGDYLVQELLPPPKHDELKWDLRCYVYNGDIQVYGVRTYHGQITNFRELGGGFARIRAT